MAVSGNKQERSNARGLAGFLVFALILHLVLLPAVAAFFESSAKAPAGGAKRHVDLISLAPSASLHHKNSGKRPPSVDPQEQPRMPVVRRDPPKKEEPLRGQVVDLPPSPDSRPPEHADYLSEHNTRTEHETRSRHASADYKNVMNEPTRAEKHAPSTPQPQQNAKALEVGPAKPKVDSKRPVEETKVGALEIPKVRERDRLALRFDPTLGQFKNQAQNQALEGNSDRLKIAPGQTENAPSTPGSAPNQGLTMADLVPQVGVLARLQGGPSNDALDHVDEGEGTFLNSREFKYASFFNRLKRGVSQHWKPLAEYTRRDPTGNIYGYRARVTVLSVTLSADGGLVDVEVKQSSGVDFLDREAVAAFRRAEPFPNPPKGLVDDSGKITFPFGFHVDFNSRGFQSPPMPY